MLDPPLYPERGCYQIGDDAAVGAFERLRLWVRGSVFHPYGFVAREHPDYDIETGPLLDVRAALTGAFGSMRFTITYRQAGGFGRTGFVSGHSSLDDAAYSALTGIEQDERDFYECDLVEGVA